MGEEGKRTVVVYEIGDTDAEEGGVETGVETCYAFSLDDSSDGVIGRGLCSFGFDLGAGGEGDEGIAGTKLSVLDTPIVRRGIANVNVMDKRPPPAPARAWAMLSPCCAAGVTGAAMDWFSGLGIASVISTPDG